MSDFIWVEKYRRKTIEECILPSSIKKTFTEFLNRGEIPNMLLSGPPGIGKTTVAKALCNELGVDFYLINGSDEGRFLDSIRNQAKQFASTVSLTKTAKHKETCTNSPPAIAQTGNMYNPTQHAHANVHAHAYVNYAK